LFFGFAQPDNLIVILSDSFSTKGYLLLGLIYPLEEEKTRCNTTAEIERGGTFLSNIEKGQQIVPYRQY